MKYIIDKQKYKKTLLIVSLLYLFVFLEAYLTSKYSTMFFLLLGLAFLAPAQIFSIFQSINLQETFIEINYYSRIVMIRKRLRVYYINIHELDCTKRELIILERKNYFVSKIFECHMDVWKDIIIHAQKGNKDVIISKGLRDYLRLYD